MDNVLKQLQIQFDMLLNVQSKLKSMMESWVKVEVEVTYILQDLRPPSKLL